MAASGTGGHILGYILKVELTRFVGGLKGKYEKKKEARDDLKVLTEAIERMELPVTELGKTQQEQGGRGEYL